MIEKTFELEKNEMYHESTFEYYTWWIESGNVRYLRVIAADDMVNIIDVMRTIIDWACDKMVAEEEFQTRMSRICHLRHNANDEKVKRTYRLNGSLNAKLMEVKEKYCIRNLSKFINESIRYYAKEHGYV